MSQQQVTPSVIASANLNGFAQTAPVDEGQQFDPQIILPDNFEVGKATADGNGFFDSFRQSLEQQRGITVTVEQLRQVCKEFAQNNPPEWFENAIYASGDHNNGKSSKKPKKNKNQKTQKNIKSLENYVQKIEKNDYWGKPDIEGRVISEKYNVKLHVIETHDASIKKWVHQIIDKDDSKSIDEHKIDYGDNTIVHILNRGQSRFEPLLDKKKIQKNNKAKKQKTLQSESAKDISTRYVPSKNQKDDKRRQSDASNQVVQDGLRKNNLNTHTSIYNRELVMAAGEGNLEEIKHLIVKEADVNVKNADVKTPVQITTEQSIIQLLQNSTFFDAVAQGDLSRIANASYSEKSGWELLKVADKRSNIERKKSIKLDVDAQIVHRSKRGSDKPIVFRGKSLKSAKKVRKRYIQLINGAIPILKKWVIPGLGIAADVFGFGSGLSDIFEKIFGEEDPSNQDVLDKLRGMQDHMDGKFDSLGKNHRLTHSKLESLLQGQQLNHAATTDGLNRNYEAIRNVSAGVDRNYEGINRNFAAINKNLGAINRNYGAILAVDAKVDRNLIAMQSGFAMIGHGLDRNYGAVVQSIKDNQENFVETQKLIKEGRYEMRQGFTNVLKSINKSRIEPLLSQLTTFIEYFENEKEAIKALSKENRLAKLEEQNGVLYYLKSSKTPVQTNGLHSLLDGIINQRFAIPESSNDETALMALEMLCYGTETYALVMMFVLKEYTYLADVYYQQNELEKFNQYVSSFLNNFEDFKNSLSNTNRRGLVDKVIDILQQTKELDFIINEREDIVKLALEKIAFLSKLKYELEETNKHFHQDIYQNIPRNLIRTPDFSKSRIRTPIREWKNGTTVSYAVQLVSEHDYSRVSKWSTAYTISGKANPTLHIPVDLLGRTRLIFRKFDSNRPKLVGIIEDRNQTEFRDISRDLYNAASEPNQDLAIGEIETFINNGADVNAKYDKGRQAIHAAAGHGNSEVALALIRNCTDIYAKDINGFSPVHIAAEAGYETFIETLANHGADINSKTNSELTPLHIASYEGHENIVRFLIRSYTIDINAQAYWNYTALHIASVNGNYRVTKILAQDSRTNLNARSQGGFTPLHLAADSDRNDIAKILTQFNNTDVNAQSEEGLTALHLASTGGYENLAKILLESNRININAEAAGNMTALHFAAAAGSLDIVKLLIKQNEIDINSKTVDKWTPLHLAVALKKEDVVTELIAIESVEINSKAEGDLTPLHLAVVGGQSGIVSSLLSKGALLEEQAQGNLTALHLASMYSNKEISSTLLSNRANTKAKAMDDLTPLHLAAMYKNKEVVDVLLQTSTLVEVNAKAANNLTSLHFAAAASDYKDIILNLLQYNTTIDAQDSEERTPLYVAFQFNNTKVAKTLIDRGANINLRLANGKTLLHLAAKYGDDYAVINLIGNKIAVNVTDNNGWQPLHYAADNGKTSICNVLLNREANIDAKCKWNEQTEDIALHLTSLHLAARNGHKETVLALLGRGADINAKSNYSDDPVGTEPSVTALHIATITGHVETVRALISRSADVNAKDKDDDTPLHLAAQGGKSEIVNILIERNASHINSKASNNFTPLHYAALNGHTEIVLTLLNNGANINSKSNYRNDPAGTEPSVTALHWAAKAGHIETARTLLDRGADVNAKDKDGDTPLYLVIEKSNVSMVKLLVQSRASANIKNNNGWMSIHLAALNGKTEIVNILIEHDSSVVREKGKNSFEPLHCAALNSQNETVLALLDRGANINAKSNYIDDPSGTQASVTALHLAASAGHTETVRALLVRGAAVNAKDKDGNTPLHLAANKGFISVVRAIISVLPSSVEMGIRNNNDWTPLELAIEKGFEEIVQALVNAGVNVNERDKNGHTPLDHAVRKGSNSIATILRNKGATRKKRFIEGKAFIKSVPRVPQLTKIEQITSTNVKILSTQLSQNNAPIIDNESQKSSDAKNISAVSVNSFLSSENASLVKCLADALDNVSSKRYQTLRNRGVAYIPSTQIAVDFALNKFDSFVRSKIRNLNSEEQARIRTELENVRPEIIASLERGVEFSGNVGLDDVLKKCKECFCNNILPEAKESTCISDL